MYSGSAGGIVPSLSASSILIHSLPVLGSMSYAGVRSWDYTETREIAYRELFPRDTGSLLAIDDEFGDWLHLRLKSS